MLSHGFSMQQYPRMMYARWHCKVCGCDHVKHVNKHFCHFEYVCCSSRLCVAYVVRLNPVDCLTCSPENKECYKTFDSVYDTIVVGEDYTYESI